MSNLTRFQTGDTAVVNASYTRPANTTQYTANDAIANSTTAPVVLTFDNAALGGGGSGIIHTIEIVDSANQATKPQIRLWLFDTSPTAVNDADPFTISDAEHATALPNGIQDFTSWLEGDKTAGTGNCSSHATSLAIPFKCTSNSDSLYGLLEVRNTYTPTSAEVFTVRLGILQD